MVRQPPVVVRAITAAPQGARAPRQPDAVQLLGRVRAPGPPTLEARLKVAPGAALVPRRLPSAITLPQGLDAGHGRVLPRTFVPKAQLLTTGPIPVLVARAPPPPRLGARLPQGAGVRLPRQPASRSRTPLPRTLTRVRRPQELPARRLIEPTLRRTRLRMRLAQQRRAQPPVVEHALRASLPPGVVPAGVAARLVPARRRPPMRSAGHARGRLTQASAQITKRPLLRPV